MAARPVRLGRSRDSSSSSDAGTARSWRRPAGRRLGTGRASSAAVPREGRATRVARRVVELLLDPQQLVVLGHPLGARRRAGLDLAAVRGYGEVRDGGVLGLAGAVA